MNSKLAYILIAILGVVGLASNVRAQADVVYSSSFEGTLPGPWVIQGNAGFDVGAGYANWGSNNGWVANSQDWNALVFSTNTSPFMQAGHIWHCYMQAWVRSSGNVSNFYMSALGGGTINELGPLSGASLGGAGSYVKLTKTFDFDTNPGYMIINGKPVQAFPHAMPAFRAGFWGNGTWAWLQVDDIGIRCSVTGYPTSL